MFNPSQLFAQLSEPNTEAVFGGRINTITSTPVGSDSALVYITTESANSAFYSIVSAGSSNISYAGFSKVASMDASAGLGDNIQDIAVHNSGVLFYVNNGDLYQTHYDSTNSMHLNSYAGVGSVVVRDSILLFMSGNQLFFGLLDSTGFFTENINSPLSTSLGGNVEILIAPQTKLVYLFASSMSGNPTLIKLSDAYYSLSSMTSETDISPTTLNTLVEWRACGLGPDGRVFISGSDFNNLYFAHSDDEATWVETNTGIQGSGGSNIAFSDTSSTYCVFSGKLYNSDKGDVSWSQFGSSSLETNPNDGAVHYDLNTGIVFMTTDMGLGVSIDNGPNINEANNGIEAVQVNGIDMTLSKASAWVASKSGIRQVQNYTTSPVWSNAIYPNGDGSPYWSVAINPEDSNCVYVGNIRVYKTNDGGATWNNVFTAENAPYNYPSFGSYGDITIVSALAICPLDTNIVMAGYNREDSLGGLFVSEDAGNSWSQILLEASIEGQDVNVRDIAFYTDGMDTIAYVGINYSSTYMQGRSVYRIVKTSGGWVAAQDMDASNTAVGYQITATIRDLEIVNDTIFAAGTDAGINHPIAYYRDLGDSTALWEAFTTSGFPYVSGKKGRAITVGKDTLYCAVDNEIYFYELNPFSSAWQLGYAYPNGTKINFLFFDDLLVGTGTGLYGHFGLGVATKISEKGWGNSDDKIKVYPNPALSHINVLADEAVVLRIYATSGKLIKTLSLEEGNHEIKLNELSSGRYVLSFESNAVKKSEQLLLIK